MNGSLLLAIEEKDVAWVGSLLTFVVPLPYGTVGVFIRRSMNDFLQAEDEYMNEVVSTNLTASHCRSPTKKPQQIRCFICKNSFFIL